MPGLNQISQPTRNATHPCFTAHGPDLIQTPMLRLHVAAQVPCLAGSSSPPAAEVLPQQPEVRPPPSPPVERPKEDDRPEMASPILQQDPLPSSPEHLGASSSVQQSLGSAVSEEEEEVSSKLMETPVGGIQAVAMDYAAAPATSPDAAMDCTAGPSATPAAAPHASMSAGSVGSCASSSRFMASPVVRPALDFASPGISLASGDEASEAPSPDPGYAAGEGDGAALKRHRPG